MTRRTILISLLAWTARAEEPAWQGYDPVAYFTRGAATPGDAGITLTFAGRTIRFSTTAHREMFRRAPRKYSPQYDGQCTYALSQHQRMEADPRAFSIVGGRLFLFSKPELVSRFQQDAKRLLAAADAYWDSLQANGGGKGKP